MSKFFRSVFTSISNLKSELKKCSWPWESDPKVKGFKKYRELWGSTLMVLVAMLLLGAYVAFFDFVMAQVINAAINFLS
ncbi:MAG TPA: preprotein translocase subunit SecE [Candidatus Akkermansia intestinigallinarum]|uniref:Preprotein translocase subunit SecE n=1 Tax=Candidatus Akkermansia intestinigallinarum TaxID=2838431 RepID=A0A9D1VA52_9BACT|nr:preprotein translocase subunit SecE [Candidatus Akkermansia intestinigallinarum]